MENEWWIKSDLQGTRTLQIVFWLFLPRFAVIWTSCLQIGRIAQLKAMLLSLKTSDLLTKCADSEKWKEERLD